MARWEQDILVEETPAWRGDPLVQEPVPAPPRLSPEEAGKRAKEVFDTAVEMGIPLKEADAVVETTRRGMEIEVSPRAAEFEAKAKILAKKHDLDKPETPWSGLTSIKPPPEFERIYRAYSKLKPKVVSFGEVVTEPERPWMAALMAALPASEPVDRVALVKELLAWESPGLFIGPDAKPGDEPTVHMGYIQPPDARVPRPLDYDELKALTDTIQAHPDSFSATEMATAYRMSQTVAGGKAKDFQENYESLFASAFTARMQKELANRVPWYDRVLSAAASFQQGAVYTVSSLPKAVAILARGLDNLTGQYFYGADASTKDLALWKMGQALTDFAAKAWPTRKDLQGRFLEDALPRGAGSMLGFIITGSLARWAAQKGLAVVGPRTMQYLAPALAGMAAEGTEGFEDALASGASEDVAFQVFLLRLPGGALEALPVGRMLGRLNAGLGGKLVSTLLKEGATEAFENAVQEGLQQGWGNAVARMTYDPDRGLGEGVLEAVAIGGITGFLASAVITASTGAIPDGAKNLSVEQQMKLRAIRDAVAVREAAPAVPPTPPAAAVPEKGAIVPEVGIAPPAAKPAPAVGAEAEVALQAPTLPQAEKEGPGAQVAAEVAPEAKPEALAEAPPKHTVLGDFHAEESGAFRAKGAEEVVEATESALRQTFGQAKGLWRGIVDLPGNILRAVPAENPIGKLRDWVGPRVSVAFGRPAEWVESYFQAKGSTELAKLRVAKIAADMTGAFKKAGLDPNDAQTMLRIEAAVRGEVPMESLPPVGQEWAKTIRSAQDTESLYAAEIFDQVGLPEKAELYRKNVGKYLKHVPITDVSLTAKTRAFIGRLVGPRLSSAWGKRAKTRWDVYVGQEIVASFDPATDPQAEVKARAAYQEAVESTKVELATKRWQAKKWTLTRKGKVPVTKTVRVDGKPVRKFTGEFLDWMKTVEGAGPEAADLYRKAAGRVHLVEPISAQWRLEHEVHDPRYLLARGAVEARHDAEMARLFSVAAERWGQEAPTEMTEEEVAAWAEDGGLVQLPESGRLHDLKGMYVPKNIALDLTDMVRAPSMLGRLYQQYLGVWKESKTVWNPATHGRNIIGNVGVFSYLARCSPLNPLNGKFYVQATQELRKRGEAYEDLVRFGAVGTEYYGAELHRLNDIVQVQGEGRLDSLMALQRAARDNLGALYALEDQWFKTAAFLKYRSEGMSAQAAAEEVNKWFPNYARIGKLTRILRQSPIGAPFLSFVDQSIRIGARAVRDRPIRLLALAAFPEILSYLSALALGLSDEEKELIDKQRGYFEPIMPFRGARGQVMTLDLRYIMPLANDIAPEFRGDLFILPWFLQSPMLRAGVEQTVNKDLFLGRPIVTDTMTAAEKLKARLGKVALTAAPYPTGVVYGPGRIGRAMDEDGRETLGLAILGTLSGINIRPAYVSEHDVREVVKNAWLEGEPELAETVLRLWNDRYRPADHDRLVLANIVLGAISGWSQARTIALQEAAAMLSAGDEGGAKERLEVYNTTVLPEIRKKSPKTKELDIPAARRFVSQVETKRAYKPLGAAENP